MRRQVGIIQTKNIGACLNKKLAGQTNADRYQEMKAIKKLQKKQIRVQQETRVSEYANEGFADTA